jgi:hypothetical protein
MATKEVNRDARSVESDSSGQLNWKAINQGECLWITGP